MKKYTISEICKLLGVEVPESCKSFADETLSRITASPNLVRSNSAFILSHHNAEKRREHFNKAVKAGAKVIILSNKVRCPGIENVPHIRLPYSGYLALYKISADMRSSTQTKIIAVTGSIGKTTTKEIIWSVMNQHYKAGKNHGNSNTASNILNNLQTFTDDLDFYVQEYGVHLDYDRDMSSKAKACLPNATVITTISDPHLDVFKTKENLFKEKLKLGLEMNAGDPIIVNYDDEYLKTATSDKHPIITYSVNDPSADYYAEDLVITEGCMTFNIVHKERRTPITLHAFGVHNVGNVLAAAAVGEWFGVSQEEITEAIASFRSEGIRQSLTNIGGYQLYVDCYNTAPVSLLGDIKILDDLSVAEGGKRIAVMGDIARLGERAAELHMEVGRKIAASKLDIAICFGNENAKIMAEAIRQNGTAALYTSDRDVLNDWIRGLVTRKDVVLFKGPVARLLSKSIDQVFGTSYHVGSEHYDNAKSGDFRAKIIYEKEHHDKKMAALVKYQGTGSVVSTPSKVDGTDTFCIASGCFENDTTLQEVTVNAPVFNIASNAFSGCSNLTRVELPSTIKMIEDGAFKDCAALTEIVIPEGAIHIGSKAFSNCTGLTKVTLPTTLGYIAPDAFENCPANI